MHFYDWKEYYSILTNGETELEIFGFRYDCGVKPGKHIVGQDGEGNTYIDGKLAHIELREREKRDQGC